MSDEEKPSTAFILSLVSGVLILLGAATTLLMGAFMGATRWGGMMGGGMMPWMGGWNPAFGFVFSAIGFLSGAIVLYSASMLNTKPQDHATWGTLILVFSLISVAGGWGGFGIGLILGLIGGALAISWKPPTAPSLPSARFCTHCGRTTPLDAKFCPSCGKQLPP